MSVVRLLGVLTAGLTLALVGCSSSEEEKSEPLGADAQTVYDTLAEGERDLQELDVESSVCSDAVSLGVSGTADTIPGVFSNLANIERDDLVAGIERFIEDCQSGVFDAPAG